MLAATHLFENARRLNLFLEAFEGLLEGLSFFDNYFCHASVTSFRLELLL